MKPYKRLLFILSVICCLSSCRKDDNLGNVDNIPGLGGDTWVQTGIDKYIFDSLTGPYNIDVSYKWDQLALAQIDKNVAPIKEANVIPVIDAMKRVWIEPYIAEFGEAPFRKYCPKFFIFAGSGAYSLDGSVLLGLAGGGRQIYLFLLNHYRNKTMQGYTLSDTAVQKTTFHTIEHEFTHIFDQTKQRPFEFDQVCQGFYSADWINSTNNQAYSEGFISPYASSQPGEDFAEMVAFMLVEGKAGFDKIVNGITGTSSRGTTAATAKARLKQKEEILTRYFIQTWGINLTSLQARTRNAINKEFY